MCGCHLHGPSPGTWPTTQACVLTGNWTGNPLILRPELNPLSHTSQGKCFYFEFWSHQPFRDPRRLKPKSLTLPPLGPFLAICCWISLVLALQEVPHSLWHFKCPCSDVITQTKCNSPLIGPLPSACLLRLTFHPVQSVYKSYWTQNVHGRFYRNKTNILSAPKGLK